MGLYSTKYTNTVSQDKLNFTEFFNSYICLSGVYSLQTATNSLTTTLALTVRKFISLLISIIYFKNEFTIFHWIGTILVFGGSLTFVWTASKQSSNNSQKKQN